MDRPIVFLVVANDKYELPVYCCDTAKELAEYLGLTASSVSARLVQAKDGIQVTKNRKLKYMRLNPATGSVYVGKLPRQVHGFLLDNGLARRKRPKRPVAYIKNGEEKRFDSVTIAAKSVGISKNTIYAHLKNGTMLAGGYWRFV